jgi:hypothetical protein
MIFKLSNIWAKKMDCNKRQVVAIKAAVIWEDVDLDVDGE